MWNYTIQKNVQSYLKHETHKNAHRHTAHGNATPQSSTTRNLTFQSKFRLYMKQTKEKAEKTKQKV